jgi:predicted PurR-regulated permease PerM
MTQAQLTRIALSMAIVALAIFIAERVWSFGQTLGALISLIAVSWLIGLMVRPLIDYFRGGLMPAYVIRWVDKRFGERVSTRLAKLRLPFGVAIALVYLFVLFVLVGGIGFITATILPQAVDLIQRIPELSQDLPQLIGGLWNDIARRFNLNPDVVNLSQFVSLSDVSAWAATTAGTLATQAINLAALTASALGQILLVVILSLYVVVEDKLITRQFLVVIPRRWHEPLRETFHAIERSFIGYLRTQIISAIIHGLVALIVFALFGLNFGVVVAILAAVLSFIPLVGTPIAILIASIVTFIVKPDAVLPVVIIMLVMDQIVVYALVPKLMSDSVGVPSLLQLLSLGIGLQLLGFWGLIFSVPIAGAVYAVIFDVIMPRVRKRTLEDIDPELAQMMRRNIKTEPSVKVESEKLKVESENFQL